MPFLVSNDKMMAPVLTYSILVNAIFQKTGSFYGTRYFFRLDEQGDHPDPTSISQPDGVHGTSELLDRNDFPWDDELRGGLPLSSMIIYELHTGAFSGSHDFEGIIKRLVFEKKS